MTDRRRFQVVAPQWGEAHLTLEAVVAFVDDELAAGPHDRAIRHLEGCAECAAEVGEQRRARSVLRGADAPTLPPSLMSALRSIPQDSELPVPPVGLACTADGELVSVLRPAEFVAQQSGPLWTGPQQPGEQAELDRPRARSRFSRRARIGTGAAVSGIAIGALAFGLPVATSSAPVPGSVGVTRFATTDPASAPRQRPSSSAPATGGPATPAGLIPGVVQQVVREVHLPSGR